MSLDKSLKSGGALTRHRNVLSRAERVEQLADEEKWQDGDGVFGLPKVAHRKVQTRKAKPAAATAAAEAPAEGAEAAAEGAEAAPAARAATAEAAPQTKRSKP
jgi:small basic protein (TIGR04137 family)